MFFRFGITTPANTAESAKQKTVLKVAYGVVHHVEIQFPPGPVGLLHLHINDALHQVWPINADEDFASHNINMSFREFIPMFTEPFEFQAYTWNLDDTYEHLVIIRLGILHPRIIAPWMLPFEDKLQYLFGRT
jgi:hypothetical protein